MRAGDLTKDENAVMAALPVAMSAAKPVVSFWARYKWVILGVLLLILVGIGAFAHYSVLEPNEGSLFNPFGMDSDADPTTGETEPCVLGMAHGTDAGVANQTATCYGRTVSWAAAIVGENGWIEDTFNVQDKGTGLFSSYLYAFLYLGPVGLFGGFIGWLNPLQNSTGLQGMKDSWSKGISYFYTFWKRLLGY